MLKRNKNLIIWTLFLMALTSSLGFVNRKREGIICKSVSINIDRTTDHYFVEQEDVNSVLADKNPLLIGKEVNDINIKLLEKNIKNNPFIYNAEVYSGIDGELKIDVVQRNPILRMEGVKESYYVDETGVFMPLSDKYTARVMIASGYLFEPFAYKKARIVKEKVSSDDSLFIKEEIYAYSLKDSLFTLAKFIDENEFWKAQIQQIFITPEHEFELIPAVGKHKIAFGNIEGMKEKFDKLMLFYKEGLSKTGWNKYREINLRFKDQVVCVKN
jgi:cell division protein FtsQ